MASARRALGCVERVLHMVILFLFLLSFAAFSTGYPRKANRYCLHSPLSATSLPGGLLRYVILVALEIA